MKCRQCGREFGSWAAKRTVFCNNACAQKWAQEGTDEEVTVMVVKVPPIWPELRPRLGEVLRATRRKGYTSTAYIFEQAGKRVLLRSDEVVEVNTVQEAGQ